MLEGLEKDIYVRVLEKVLENTPMTWCIRMCVVPKKNGSLCQTVDFRAVNNAAPRQTHPVIPPFLQAASVPGGVYKTCLGAWEGYHSTPTAKEDHHITTFITPWGQYHSKVLPHGFLMENNTYCQIYDKITTGFKDLTHCVDDALFWDKLIRENFFGTCGYLSMYSLNGITFNLKKFQFCQEEINFVGLQLTWGGMRLLEEILQSIRDFHRPVGIKGIHSFFGLVE